MAISNLKKFGVAFLTFVCRIIAYYFCHSWLHNLMNTRCQRQIFRSFLLAWRENFSMIAKLASKCARALVPLYALERLFQNFFFWHIDLQCKMPWETKWLLSFETTYFKLVDWVCSSCLFRMHQVQQRFIAVRIHNADTLSAARKRKNEHDERLRFDNKTDLRPKFTSITLAIGFITFTAFSTLLPYFFLYSNIALSLTWCVFCVCLALFVTRDVMNLMKRIWLCVASVYVCIYFSKSRKNNRLKGKQFDWMSTLVLCARRANSSDKTKIAFYIFTPVLFSYVGRLMNEISIRYMCRDCSSNC